MRQNLSSHIFKDYCEAETIVMWQFITQDLVWYQQRI